MIQGGGGKLLELKYPSANVSLHYRPGISLPHKILSQFGIKDNDVTVIMLELVIRIFSLVWNKEPQLTYTYLIALEEGTNIALY